MLRLGQQFFRACFAECTTYSCSSLLQPNAAMLLCCQGTVIALIALHHCDYPSQGLHLSCSCYLQHQGVMPSAAAAFAHILLSNSAAG